MLKNLKNIIKISFIALLLSSQAYAQNSQIESLTGEFQTVIEDFPDGTHRTIHLLVDDKKKVHKLKFVDLEERDISRIKHGTRIKIQGRKFRDNYFTVDSLVSSNQIYTNNNLIQERSVTGSRKIAIILVNLSDVSTPCNSTDVDNVMFSDTQNVQGLYEASSRGQLTFARDTDGDSNPDIFGPFTIAASSTTCDPYTWASQAESLATTSGVNLSLYQHRMFILPNYTSLTCGWAGLANVACGSSCRAWIAACNWDASYAHELGHNLGMKHAATDTNNDGTIDVEYGDWSCPMGNGSNMNHFNAPHQDQMGWFDSFSGKVQEITASGTYTIKTFEADSSSITGAQIFKIANSSGQYYYLSFRKNTGTYGEPSTSYRDKLNIHTYDGSSIVQTKFVKAISVSQNFSDSTLGLNINLDSQNSSEAIFSVTLSGSTTDTDLDGVSDFQESVDGTNLNDRGSFFERLSNPIFALWNSFLGMYNIVELINPSSSTASSVTLELYDINGSLTETNTYYIAPNGQFDVILNDWSTYTSDSYGIVKIIVNSGEIDGRISYYKVGSSSNYDFAYSLPFKNPLTNESTVTFNTFQPSLTGSDYNQPVYNWLTLVNLDSSSKSFTVYSYNQGGTLIGTPTTYTLPAFGRIDVDGGHGFLGPNVVGLHRIVPSDLTAPYQAQVIRYGTSSSGGFSFAFPLNARAGNGEIQHTPISRNFGEENWLEVANTTSSNINATITLRNSSGVQVYNSTVTLPAYSQQHFYVSSSSYLNEGESGFATISSNIANSIISQSMFYFKNTNTGNYISMFGTEANEALSTTQNGSYNLYLNMGNALRISNTSSSATIFDVNVETSSGTTTRSYSISANSTGILSLHDYSFWNTSADSYGRVQVETSTNNVLFAELLRYKTDSNSQIEFVFPTKMRPQ